MKKITLILLLQVIMLSASAQEEKIPTKLETMDWIAGKLKQYMRLPNNRTFLSYGNGIFVYEKRTYTCDNRLAVTSKNTIDLNKVADYSICYFKPNHSVDLITNGSYCDMSEIKGQNLIYTASTNHLSGRFTYSYGNEIRIAGELDSDCDPINWSAGEIYTGFNLDLEAGLLTRMAKALKALIKYNTIKPGEVW